MTPSVGPVTAAHVQSVFARRTASPQLTSTASKPVERVVERTEPIDRVEISPNLLGDPRRLKAAGPGVPLFTTAELPAPETTGEIPTPEAPASGRDSLVNAFG